MTALSTAPGVPTPPAPAVHVRRRVLSVEDHVQGVLLRDRAALGRAITLIESRNPEHQKMAQEVLLRLLPHAGHGHRVGITGIPGAGKSTFIEALGVNLTRSGHRVAVLAVDPTSKRTGGSILGDKTRMAQLSADTNAFIRPSPSSGTLGGVTRTTRETMLVCEAAGYDVILIETVGAGQSETAVADMVDFFLVLMLPGAGDELQGIKKGVLELADMIAVNKAEGDNEGRAKRAAHDYANALHILKPASPTWSPPVITCSGLYNIGLDKLWAKIVEHRARLTESGELQDKRRQQQIQWMWSMMEDRLMDALRRHPQVIHDLPATERDVIEGRLTATLAVDHLLKAFGLGAT